MVYFDNSATTLEKPPAVGEAVAAAIHTLGNAGRSFYDTAVEASRTVLAARQAIARLTGLQNTSQVAFTSGATESLNLVLWSLVKPGAHVITSVLEHNAVLRPLYQMGCRLSFLDCDEEGALRVEALPALYTDRTQCVICTHGSNVLGSIAPAEPLRAFCHEHQLPLILDCAQTLGAIPVSHDMADVLCFTGHKALMGPQGTGGIIARADLPFSPTKTGGSGFDGFATHPSLRMPEVFEAGTQNAHGLAGLQAGVEYLLAEGVEAVHARETALCGRFLRGISDIPPITVYGPVRECNRLPVVSLNLAEEPSEEVALALWERWRIATRPGMHCAPLVHRRFGTERQGMVRFSFGYFNTEEEVDYAVDALRTLATP